MRDEQVILGFKEECRGIIVHSFRNYFSAPSLDGRNSSVAVLENFPFGTVFAGDFP